MFSHDAIGEYLGSYQELREVTARQVVSTVRPEEMTSDVLRRLYARLRCNRCGRFGKCPDRNRAEDLRLIQRLLPANFGEYWE